MSEIANGGFQRRLCHAHDIVVGNDPFRAKIGQRDDRSPIGHQGQCRTRHRDERIRADVERSPEALARRVDKVSGQFFPRCICNRMNQEIEFARFLSDAVHQRLDLRIVSCITHERLRARQGSDQFFNVLLQALILIVEEELRALAGGGLSDRPGDAVLVGHAHDQPCFAGQ